MQLKEFDILLDVKKHNKIEYIEVVQGDLETNVLNIKLISDLKNYDLTGTTVEIAFSKSDGTTVIQDQQNGVAILNTSEGKIQCILNTNTIASPGKVLAEVRVFEGVKLLTSSRFEFFVRRSIVNDETIESTNEFPLLQRLTDDVQGIIATEGDRVQAEENRQTNEDIRLANEIVRIQAEDERATTFAGYETRVSTVEDDLIAHKEDYATLVNDVNNVVSGDIQALINNGVVATNIEEKLNNKEIEYAPRLTSAESQLKQTGMDFVNLIRNHNEVASNIFVKKIKDRSLEVAIPYKGDMCGYYLIEKDANDDYIKLKSGAISSVTDGENIYMKKNVDSTDGFTPLGSSPNMYTRGVENSKLFIQFEGTGLDFNHYGDTRGGVWEFNIDDGAVIKSISTWRATNGTYTSEIARGLEDKSHNVVATFKGNDPLNQPTDTARGWYSVNNPPTFNIYKVGLNGESQFDILNLNSNKEFAISVAPEGKSGEWLPDHGVGTVFSVNQEIWIDDSLVTDWTPSGVMQSAKAVKIIQSMQGFNSTDLTIPLCNIITVHTFNNLGVSVQGKIKFLQPLRIVVGYFMMLPVYPSFAERLIANNGYNYASTKTDGSTTEITGEPTSFAYVNETGTQQKQNTIIAMTIDNPYTTLRVGGDGRNIPLIFLQHRDSTLQKLYPTIFKEKNVVAGESFTFGGTYHIGEIPLASKLLI